MPRPAPTQPTPSELQILRILWSRGPSTCRDVHDVLGKTNGVGYTGVLKLMQIMVTKGLVTREEDQRSHIYRAKLSETRTQRKLVRDLIDRAFDGSAVKLMVHALSTSQASEQDLDELQSLIDKARGSRR